MFALNAGNANQQECKVFWSKANLAKQGNVGCNDGKDDAKYEKQDVKRDANAEKHDVKSVSRVKTAWFWYKPA
jgi:hypothetical protein